MTKALHLRTICARIIIVLCSFAALTAITSCHDDSHYLGSEADRAANGFYIDNVRTHVEVAGFYYNEQQHGYNIFFSSLEEDMHKGLLTDRGIRRFLSIDLPESKLGRRVALNSAINDADAEHYRFQLVTDHVPGFPRISTSIGNITGGYVEFSISNEWVDSYTKNVSFELHAEISNGRVIDANYKGQAQICTNYIGWWGRALD